MLFEDYFIIIPVIVAGFSISILLYYYFKIKNIVIREEEVSSTAQIILSDFVNRIEILNRKLMDQQIKLDILEVQTSNKIVSKVSEINKESDINVASRKLKDLNYTEKLNVTEIEVIKLISQGMSSPSELKKHLNKSREHTSRLLKNLFETNYLLRKGNKKSYIYYLTEKGNILLSSLSTSNSGSSISPS